MAKLSKNIPVSMCKTPVAKEEITLIEITMMVE